MYLSIYTLEELIMDFSLMLLPKLCSLLIFSPINIVSMVCQLT